MQYDYEIDKKMRVEHTMCLNNMNRGVYINKMYLNKRYVRLMKKYDIEVGHTHSPTTQCRIKVNGRTFKALLKDHNEFVFRNGVFRRHYRSDNIEETISADIHNASQLAWFVYEHFRRIKDDLRMIGIDVEYIDRCWKPRYDRFSTFRNEIDEEIRRAHEKKSGKKIRHQLIT